MNIPSHFAQSNKMGEPDKFFRIEFMDTDSTKRSTLSSPKLSSAPSSPLQIYSDASEDPWASEMEPLLNVSDKAVNGETWELISFTEFGWDKTTEFRERALHSDIVFNCTLHDITYNRAETIAEPGTQSPKGQITERSAQQSITGAKSFINHKTASSNVLNAAPAVSPGKQDAATTQAKRELEAAFWYLPQPVNLARARNSHPWTLEAIQEWREQQNNLFEEIGRFLDPKVGWGRMDKYYAFKYESAAADDPFVKHWLRARADQASIAETPVLQSQTGGATISDSESLLRKRADLETEPLQSHLVNMFDESAAREDNKRIVDRWASPEYTEEHGRLGQVVTQSVSSLLYDPDDCASNGSSKTKSVATLQSMRTRRHLPKLPPLKTSF